MIFKIVRGEVAIKADDHLTKADQRTRKANPHKFRHFQAKCEQYRHSFFPRMVPAWNQLPEAVVIADTTATFTARLRAAP